MSLIKKLGKDILGITIALGITTGALTAINFYKHHNVNYKTENKDVFQKADGVFSYTELIINQNNSKEIRRHSIINSKSYEDTDNDGKVEKFTQWYHPFNRGPNLRRFDKEQLKNNSEIAEKVNNEFKGYLGKFR